MIVPILSLIFVITFVTCVVIKGNRETTNLQNAKIREQEEKLNSVVPETILRKENKSGNPFNVDDLPSIKILETKRNSYGEIWIKYAYEKITTAGEYFENWPAYDSLENKLKLYPIIELPKNNNHESNI
jgi:hypothetical protein